jgi:4-oxalocrotonate tautomerase
VSRKPGRAHYKKWSALLHFMSWTGHHGFPKVGAERGNVPSNQQPEIESNMPLINVKILENVFTPEQKKQIITKLTDAMVSIEGEALRPVTWVMIEEMNEGNCGIGGQALYARDVHQMQKKSA